MIGTIIWAIVAGAVLGVLARILLPGRQRISWGLTILVGIGAAFLGGVVATWLGVGNTPGIDWVRHGIQVALAMVGVGLVSAASSRRRA